MHRLVTRWVGVVTLALTVTVTACGQPAITNVAALDLWARQLLARPIAEVCAQRRTNDYFCQVSPALLSDVVRRLGATNVWLQNLQHSERYITLDWGGGFSEAYGLDIGPLTWAHAPNPDRNETRIRAGVFAFSANQ